MGKTHEDCPHGESGDPGENGLTVPLPLNGNKALLAIHAGIVSKETTWKTFDFYHLPI